MRKLTILILFLLPVSLFLTGCQTKENVSNDDENEQLVVYTTVYPLMYFTKEIGKELVHVESIYPPGADEHSFEPSQKDMVKLADSDLFIYIGLGLEGFVDKAKDTLASEHVTMLAAGEHIHFMNEEHNHEDDNYDHEHESKDDEHEHEGTDEHEHTHGDVDPHVWIDPLYAKEIAHAIKDELIHLLPEHTAVIEQNYTELANRLNDLHEQFASTLSSAKDKHFIVSHAAYGYWEERYDIEQISINGLSSSSEPTQKQLENIMEEANEHGIKHIFFEQNVTSKLTEVIQNELGATPLLLHNLSVLTDEDMNSNRTYFTIMEDNLEALNTALNS